MWFIHWCSCAAMKDIFQMKAPRSSSFLCDVHDAMFWQPGMSSINILSHLSFFQADQRVCPVLRILWTASVYPDIQMPTAISGLWFMETQCWPKKKKSDRLAGDSSSYTLCYTTHILHHYTTIWGWSQSIKWESSNNHMRISPFLLAMVEDSITRNYLNLQTLVHGHKATDGGPLD